MTFKKKNEKDTYQMTTLLILSIAEAERVEPTVEFNAHIVYKKSIMFEATFAMSVLTHIVNVRGSQLA